MMAGSLAGILFELSGPNGGDVLVLDASMCFHKSLIRECPGGIFLIVSGSIYCLFSLFDEDLLERTRSHAVIWSSISYSHGLRRR